MFGSERRKQEANFMASQYLKIVNDCANLVNTTKNPDVFFMRWDLMVEKLTQLSSLQTYVNFKGAKPNVMLEQVKNQREQSCHHFLQRYSRDIETKIYSLKTKSAKVNKADAFHEKLIAHYEKMPQSNIDECELEYYRLVAIAQPELKLAIAQIQADNYNKLQGSIQMKYCTNCGNELKGGKFCGECGVPVEQNAESFTVIDSPQEAFVDNESVLENAFMSTGGNKANMRKIYIKHTGASLDEAKDKIDDFLASKTFLEKCEANRAAQRDARNSLSEIAFTKRGKEKLDAKNRIEENRRQGVACCPKCGSTSLSGNKKGFGIGKAVVGAALTGGIGLVAGNIGAKKVRVTCMNCGHSWKL